MKINRTVLIPVKEKSISEKDEKHHSSVILSINTTYRKKVGRGLFQQFSELVSSDTLGRWFQRMSEDNGETWSETSLIYEPEKTKDGVWRWGESCLFLDREKDSILHFFNYHLYPGEHYTGKMLKYTRIFMRISSDGGKTFSEPQQIIQKGLDEKIWAKDVIYGRNSMQLSFCTPIKAGNKIILPVQKIPLGGNFNKPFSMKWEAGYFIGEWKNNSLEWNLSEMVKIKPTRSSRGLCEPTIAELYDSSMLIICRGSNFTITDMPGYKWCSISKDGGYSWSEVFPLKYDTGENFFSPATGSRLIRNSKNKKLYWIGNIVQANPDGDRPRYPLQIAEVDEDKKAIIKETVNIIEDKQKEDSPFVQFSNFRVYEDRETHEFVLTMARIQERSEKDRTSATYQYRINILG